jgi:triacylglycerol lipase
MSFLTKLPIKRYDPNAFAAFSSDQAFALGTAKAMVWMSQLAYELDEPDKLRAILQGWGLSLHDGGLIVEEVATVLPKASTNLFIASGRGATFVAFAGTDPLVLANWISDFDVRPSSTNTAEGFMRAAEVVWSRINAVLSSRNAAAARILVTGHSLGGALAALTAKKIVSAGDPSLIGVYTFGMPRVGDQEWHRQYTDELGQYSFGMVYGDDIVPTVAPSGLGFRHIGRLLRCERDGKFDDRNLTQESESDEPLFQPGVAKELQAFLHAPMSSLLSAAQRVQLAVDISLGVAPSYMRTDSGGIAIELLPPRLRDHMPDRYASAF